MIDVKALASEAIDADFERRHSFPDQCHWSDLTIDGKPIPEDLYGTVSYWDTDQGKVIR